MTPGYGAEVVQSWSGVVEGGKEDLAPKVLVWAPVDQVVEEPAGLGEGCYRTWVVGGSGQDEHGFDEFCWEVTQVSDAGSHWHDCLLFAVWGVTSK